MERSEQHDGGGRSSTERPWRAAPVGRPAGKLHTGAVAGRGSMGTLERLKALWARTPGMTTEGPASPGAVPVLRERRRQPRPPAQNGLRALVVDDSATIVAVLRKMLRQNHYEVADATDAET